MAKGNFRANASWGCLYCGKHSRDEKHLLVIRGKDSNKMYLCESHANEYDERQAQRKSA